jgi:glycosyltransferase involved in cell wall biosynthesis
MFSCRRSVLRSTPKGPTSRRRPNLLPYWLLRSFLPLKPWSGARLVLTVHDHSLRCPKKKLLHGDAHCSGPALGKCLGCAGAHYGLAKGVPVLLSNRAMSAIERAAVDMYVPVSEAVAVDNDLLGHDLPVQVIPNFVPDDVGVPSDTAHPCLSQLPQGDFMLFVGAFGRYKGLDVLVRAYAGLRDAPPLVIIGYQTPEYPVRTVDFPPNVLVLHDPCGPHRQKLQYQPECHLGAGESRKKRGLSDNRR